MYTREHVDISVRARVTGPLPGPRSAELPARQDRRESNARVYPRHIPIAVDEASGTFVRDLDGNVFIDFLTGAGELSLGENHPELTFEEQCVRMREAGLTDHLVVDAPSHFAPSAGTRTSVLLDLRPPPDVHPGSQGGLAGEMQVWRRWDGRSPAKRVDVRRRRRSACDSSPARGRARPAAADRRGRQGCASSAAS